MQCQIISQFFDEVLDGTLSEPHQHAVHQHLKLCVHCQRRFEENKALRTALKNGQVPAPSQRFAERVLQAATVRHRHWPATTQWIGMAMAASLVIGIGMGLLLAPAGLEQQHGVQTVSMRIDSQQNVNVAFDSAHELHGVTITLSLPANVEVVGYPGQRTLSWRTNLKVGKNQLTLPLIARDGAGGVLAAALTHGKHHKEFSLYLAVQQGRAAAGVTQTLAS